MTYNPKIHNRKRMRIEGYDYSKPGKHFITICCQNRVCLFGEIVDGKMILNYAGKMVEKWYFEIQNKYPDKRCLEMVIMPNHFHCVIENVDVPNVGFPNLGFPNVNVPKTNMDYTIKNTTQPFPTQWIGSKR